MKHRVVITGMGVISPLGNSIAEFSQALFAGKPQIGAIERFATHSLPTKIAGEVKKIQSEYRDIKVSFALLAAREAIKSAFAKTSLQEYKALLSIGIGLELFSLSNLILAKQDPKNAPELNTPADICAHLIAREFSIENPPLIHISACAASTDALGSAFLKIQSGQVQMALAGGADSMINPMGVAGFCRIGAMSTRNQEPERASRPFDRDRDGFVMGEGGGFLVLEQEQFATQRGATPLAILSGYGNSLDAYNISDPHPQGEGALLAMKRAINCAGLVPSDISAVNAHGTATEKNDPAETKAIQSLLGKTSQTPVFATKSLMGHLISAAGVVETIASIICLRENKLHITANLENVANDCQLNHVCNQPLNSPLKHILKNSFGFGGQNAAIVISKYK